MRFLSLKTPIPFIAIAAVLAATSAVAQQGTTETFEANLNSLNNSGATGNAYVAYDSANDELTVIIAAEGLEPNQKHPQHIHGSNDTSVNNTCPTLAQDDNSDNQISVAEGRQTYGPIMLPLKPFPTAQDNGTVTFRHTYKLGQNGNPAPSDLLPLRNRHVVLHGLTVDGQYIATRPVACGQLVPRPRQDGQ